MKNRWRRGQPHLLSSIGFSGSVLGCLFTLSSILGEEEEEEDEEGDLFNLFSIREEEEEEEEDDEGDC
jgi:hypothetical protein